LNLSAALFDNAMLGAFMKAIFGRMKFIYRSISIIFRGNDLFGIAGFS